jgi:hypothetical protein
MLLSHVQSAWYNPPRRRRFLARSLLGWQELYDTISAISKSGKPMVSEPQLTKSFLLRIDIIERERSFTPRCINQRCALVEAFYSPRSSPFWISTGTVCRGREIICILGAESGDSRAPWYTRYAGTYHTQRRARP